MSLYEAIGKDVFEQAPTVDAALIDEYFMRNERKKEDDKWLKKHKEVVLNGLRQLEKEKADFGDYRVAYTEPDNSYLDPEKVITFLQERNLIELATKNVLDEEAVTVMIERGLINREELTAHAWVEQKGTARLSIKKVDRSDESK